jgi:hypothetical protein
MVIAMTMTHFGPRTSARAPTRHRENALYWFAHSFGMRVNGWIPVTDKM